MAKISNLGLQIVQTDDPMVHGVTVSFNLSFVPAEYGKKFRYSIKLTGTDVGEKSTPNSSAKYLFEFNNSNLRGITGGQVVQTIYSHTAQVARQFLDEDRDFHFEDPNPGGPEVHNVFPDEIVATVTLERGAVGGIGFVADRKVSPAKTFTA